MRFLLIHSNVYGDELTYKINDPSNSAHALNDLVLLVGKGSVELLGAAANNLFFSNHLPQDVTVEILVCEQAMP